MTVPGLMLSIPLAVAALNGTCGAAVQRERPAPGSGAEDRVTLVGRIDSFAGHPIAGARVAVYPPGYHRALQILRTAPDGTFTVALEKGRYAFTATAAGYTGGFIAGHDVHEGAEPVTLALRKADRVVRGTVRDAAGHALRDAVVRASQASFPEARLFCTLTDGSGRYELGLPHELHTLTVEPGDYVSPDRAYFGDGDARVDLVAYPWQRVHRPAPEAVIDWFRSRAIPLKTVAARTGVEDLRPLKSLIGEAKIVGLGEATHGTREFFQAKHRLVEYLVTELGFSVFAIEASLPEATAVNDYVMYGRGDAAAALAGMHFWIWDTEEVLAMIEWMREYNASPSHRRKLRFYGFDMQYTSGAATGVLDYIAQSSPENLRSAAADLEMFRTEDWRSKFAELAAEARSDTRRRVEKIAALLDEGPRSDEEWRRARRFVNVISQAAEKADPTGPRAAVRDRAMADNVAWIVRDNPEARVIVWSHNQHISRLDREGVISMGSYLAAAFGEHYVAVALTFGRGAFQARDVRLQVEPRPLLEQVVGPATDHYVEPALARVGLPLFVVDLRGRPRSGPVAEWFDTPHPMRVFGSTSVPPDYHWAHLLLDRHFDAILYVDRTTRARPTPTGRRDR